MRTCVQGWRTSSLLSAPEALRVFPHSFEQQASISLLHQETQLPERWVVCAATAFQGSNQLLVLCVAFQEVPDGEDSPLADNCRCPVKESNDCMVFRLFFLMVSPMMKISIGNINITSVLKMKHNPQILLAVKYLSCFNNTTLYHFHKTSTNST